MLSFQEDRRRKLDVKFLSDACKEAGILVKDFKANPALLTDPRVKQVRDKLDLRLYNHAKHGFLPKVIHQVLHQITKGEEVETGEQAREVLTAYVNNQVQHWSWMHLFSYTYLEDETENIKIKVGQAKNQRDLYLSGKIFGRYNLGVSGLGYE